MKIKKVKKYQNKLLKLKLIKTKIYNKKQYLNNIKLEDIEYRVKKVLYIIYKYHISNKKILFVGSSRTTHPQIQTLFKLTKHILIPKNIWLKGAISNKKSCFTYLSKNRKMFNNKTSEILFQLQKSIDLIVILEESDNLSVLNEGYVSRIPIVSINCSLNIQHNKPSYKIPGNFQFSNKKLLDNFFYSLLISTFKKGHSYKKFRKKMSITQSSNNFKHRFYRKKLKNVSK